MNDGFSISAHFANSYFFSETNLYVGTSTGEILHFVSIPPDPADESNSPTFIFASRLQPTYNQAQDDSLLSNGVQQILVLPKVDKACILCNGTLSFYSLPELTPAFGNTVVSNCSWVGGANLNEAKVAEKDGEVIMICVKNRIRLVRIGDEARRVRNIEYPGCLVATRRDNFACVADAHSYALLDVDNQQKISLFPISSLDHNAGGGQVEDISTSIDPSPRSSSRSRAISGEGPDEGKGHSRGSSLGAFASSLARRQQSPQTKTQDRSGLTTPEPVGRATSPLRSSSLNRSDSKAGSPSRVPPHPDKPLPPPPEELSKLNQVSPIEQDIRNLTPHICSPTPTEFLLTTGTTPMEPGVGIFVNLDGEVVRGSVEFSRYPSTVVVDGSGVEIERVPGTEEEGREGFVLATMMRPEDNVEKHVIEIQRWDVDHSESKEWLSIPTPSSNRNRDEGDERPSSMEPGLRPLQTPVVVPFPEVGQVLCATRLQLPSNSADIPSTEGQNLERPIEQWEKNRNREEVEFSQRLGGRRSHIAVWSGSSIWWAVRNPLVMRLDTAIDQIVGAYLGKDSHDTLDRSQIIKIVNGIRGQEPSTETEFLSLEYIRQKTSIILFADLLARPSMMSTIEGADKRITEGLMMEGGVEPRVMLSLIPQLRDEIIEGPRGIWIHAGLTWIMEHYWSLMSSSREVGKTHDQGNSEITSFIKRYLSAWRQRKGFGSIADEVQVFQTVDAALLRILLEQDRQNTKKSSMPSSARAELYSLVDSGVECFDRAVALLESYHRLYVLSRLYQSRKLYGKVLGTWRRIIDGEKDNGGELRDGENEVRKYLGKMKDTSVVHEYGTWLARRNPKLGVQVFTDDSSRVKMEPQNVVQLLKRQAPDAVKVYLEHLVFGKKNVQYANDLISYYLDNVFAVLSGSEDARAILAQTYESYRALRPPKPTYRQFIIENEIPASWWHDRLRLLELLGGSHGAGFSYDVGKILSRIEPFEEDLVPESIIIDGRQGRHQQALRLLTQGLGDYHTAINYCLLGGASIFHPISGPLAPNAAPSREEQAKLFGYLLSEFLRIQDINDRLERTSELLERFGSWYDVRQVLELIPETWSVELVSAFLVSAFRRLLHEKSEAMITKALSSAENLQVASTFVEKCNAIGPQIEKVQ